MTNEERKSLDCEGGPPLRAYITILGEQTVRSTPPDHIAYDTLYRRIAQPVHPWRGLVLIFLYGVLSGCSAGRRQRVARILHGNSHIDPGEKFVLALAKLGPL
jgi:hypothetical protein